jgi:predicted nuclease of predicted toxin-antitoxin system
VSQLRSGSGTLYDHRSPVKLLFDNNLSPKLLDKLADIFPESSHVGRIGLERSLDSEVWNAAREGGYILVSKDSDFNELLTTKGFPPKVIWLRLGNCTTAEAAQALRKHSAAILDFDHDDSAGLLEI